MKKFLVSSFLVCVIAFGPCQASDAIPADFYVSSPDHPSTLVVGYNDKVDQRLRWRSEDQKLIVDVTYGTVPYPDGTDQADYQTYCLTFPSVHLDNNDELFLLTTDSKKFVIGHQRPTIFGVRIDLEKNLLLSAHRKGGRLYAMILPKVTPNK